MGRTVLLAESGSSWREWLKQHRGNADLLVLDPSDASYGPASRIRLLRGEKPVFDGFYGSLDPQKAPHLVVAALVEAMEIATPNLVIQLYPYRVTPVLRQTTQLLLQLIKPDRLLVNAGFSGRLSGSFEEVDLEKSLPSTVQAAQRKAQWLSMIEKCEEHSVDLSETVLSGSRLGAGNPIGEARKTKLGLDGAYVEVSGTTLYLVTDEEFSDDVISTALDVTGCARAHFVSPGVYEGVLCSFAKLSGDDFGYGFLRSVDFINLRAQVLCTAIPPVPVPMLKLGSMRIDEKGNELGEMKPWTV
ncbi:MAG: hypothetical protein WCK51_14395 [Armatimonadota bacterium]